MLNVSLKNHWLDCNNYWQFEFVKKNRFDILGTFGIRGLTATIGNLNLLRKEDSIVTFGWPNLT